MKKLMLLILITTFTSYSNIAHPNSENDASYYIKKIKYIGSGFIKLIGPGYYNMANQKNIKFGGNSYLALSKLTSMSSNREEDQPCMLYFETNSKKTYVSVSEQSCITVIKILENNVKCQ